MLAEHHILKPYLLLLILLLVRIQQGTECRSIKDVKDKSKAHLMAWNSLTLIRKEKKKQNEKTAHDLPSKYNTGLCLEVFPQ